MRNTIAVVGLLVGVHIVVALGDEKPQPVAEAKPARIMGVVRFTGAAPPAKEIMTSDGGTITHRDLLIDGKTKGLRYVAVVLEDAPAQPKLKNAKAVAVDQRDWVFLPRVVAVQHGQRVRFENSDQVNHAVDARGFEDKNSFSVTTPPSQPFEHEFVPQKPPVLIGCSLHPWMRAWVYVLPHPWFAVTDAQGRFAIIAVPPGKYTLLLTHQDSKLRERRMVELKPGQTLELTVEWQKLP